MEVLVPFTQLEERLEEIADLLLEKMSDILPEVQDTMEQVLFEAMRYSALSKGKRLRPFLTVEVAQMFGVSMEASLNTAAAIELIHSYSLIHDDLPAIDNDDMRRGQLSCHKKFGEAIAILTGDALLTLAFAVLANEGTHRDSTVRLELIQHIAKASGHAGMIGGQVIDVQSTNQILEFNEIVRLQRMKTGELFATSCEAGAILGRAPKQLRHSLRAYANNLGLAFQITDDLLDAQGTREETGKSVGKDKAAGKVNLVSCLGIEQAKAHAEMLSGQAVQSLMPFGGSAQMLVTLVDFVMARNR
jgi:farnesyl diphosphate synthase